MRRVLLLPLLALAGCGDAPPTASRPVPVVRSEAPAPAQAPPTPPALDPARCTAARGPGCVAHTGRVLTVESVDPDGDGDLHVVATGGSVTAPGITVFDVSGALRPEEDPRPGDRVTGAGPVFRGSFGQRQIEVREFRTAR